MPNAFLDELLNEATNGQGSAKAKFCLGAIPEGQSVNENEFMFIGNWMRDGEPIEFWAYAPCADGAAQFAQFQEHCLRAGAALQRYPPNPHGFPFTNEAILFPFGCPCDADAFWVAALFYLFPSSSVRIRRAEHHCLEYPWRQSMRALTDWAAHLICSQLQAAPTIVPFDSPATVIAESIPSIPADLAPGNLPKATALLQAVEAVSQLARKPKSPEKEPSEVAFKAYRVSRLAGKSQKEIVDILTDELKRRINQGQVSRWLKKVQNWLEAGNVLPDLAKPLDTQPQAMDPEMLDLGPRQDRRTRRQRPGKSDDD